MKKSILATSIVFFIGLNTYANSDLPPAVESALSAKLESMLQVGASTIKSQYLAPDSIEDISEQPTTPEEQQVLELMANESNNDRLTNDVNTILDKLSAKYPDKVQIPPEQRQAVVEMAVQSVNTTLRVRGLTNDSKSATSLEWSELSNRMAAKINSTAQNNLRSNVLAYSQAAPVFANDIKILVNGEASFAMRDSLMKKATKSIDIMSWAIYDDLTGTQAVDLLLEKQKQGIVVRVIVDGQVSNQSGYGDQVSRLEKASVPVIRWINPVRLEQGQHRKMMIVDGQHVIAGGLNFGDVYSHKNPKSAQWRDTDLYLQGGSAAAAAENLFAKIWNDQIASRKLALKPVKTQSLPTSGSREVFILNSNPTLNQSGSPIMLTILAAIRSARYLISIENAYVVAFPELKNELAEAVKRNVTVRVLTNSNTSVDEPIVSSPILRTAKWLKQNLVDVYLKKGDTLHSKMLVVDNQFSMIMSYNLHPRSERIEGEMAIASFDWSLATHATEIFNDDISEEKATRIDDAKDIVLPEDPSLLMTLRLFFDPL